MVNLTMLFDSLVDIFGMHSSLLDLSMFFFFGSWDYRKAPVDKETLNATVGVPALVARRSASGPFLPLVVSAVTKFLIDLLNRLFPLAFGSDDAVFLNMTVGSVWRANSSVKHLPALHNLIMGVVVVIRVNGYGANEVYADLFSCTDEHLDGFLLMLWRSLSNAGEDGRGGSFWVMSARILVDDANLYGSQGMLCEVLDVELLWRDLTFL